MSSAISARGSALMAPHSPRRAGSIAKVDSAAVQDGFDLYLHGFIVTDDGHWAVVQQGMNGDRRQARRYHWLSEGLGSFVDAPHAAIAGEPQGEIVNLADRRAEPSRRGQLDLLASLGPDRIVREMRRASTADDGPAPAGPLSRCCRIWSCRRITMCGPAMSISGGCTRPWPRRTNAGPKDFAELLLTPGIGARTVRSLAMVAEIVHGAPYRFADPARFSLAHGGKDRHPFPVPITVYDQTIRVLKTAVAKARLGREEQLAALKRLDDQARRLEGRAAGPAFAQLARSRAARIRTRMAAAASSAGSRHPHAAPRVDSY